MLKKLLSISFLLIMTAGIYAQSIPSGTARYEALGYNPFIMDAATDINRNPAWSGMYRHYAFGDIGRADGVNDDFILAEQYVGVNFGVTKKMTLGLVLNKVESMWSSFQDPWASQNPDSLGPIKAPIVPIKILFSFAPSKKLIIGIAPYFAMYSKDWIFTSSGETTNTQEMKWTSSTLGGTIGAISQMKNNSWFEIAVNLKLNKFKRVITNSSPSTSDTRDNTGGMELGAFLRGWFMVNKPNKINLVPYISFSMFNYMAEIITSPTATTTGQSDIKHMNIKGGVGMNMPVLGDGMLAGGLSVGYSSYKNTSNNTAVPDVKINDFTLPQFNVGLEWNFTDWFTGRMGYMRSVIHDDQTYTAEGSTVNSQEYSESLASNPDQTITLGTGFHFNRFSIEGTIGEKFFQRGPYILSGRGTDMFGILSASYNFNKK